jgi:hypothetical protein
MIVSASLVQTNGWQRSFQPSMNRVIASISSRTELKVPQQIAWRVMIPKKISTMFSHEPRCWGEMQRDSRVPRQPRIDRRVFVGGVVVADQVERDSRVGLRYLLEEPEELLMAMPRQAGLLDPAGSDLQRGEQRRGAITEPLPSPAGSNTGQRHRGSWHRVRGR